MELRLCQSVDVAKFSQANMIACGDQVWLGLIRLAKEIIQEQKGTIE